MELRHLKYFLTLAEELHFGKAAKKLFIAQPPLSRQIKLLEEELGVLLFERKKRDIRLTEYGIFLKSEAEKLFADVNTITNKLQLIKEGSAGIIKIGYVGSALHSNFPYTLSEIKRQLPYAEIVLKELDNDTQINELKKKTIDIGFVRTPLEHDNMILKPLYSETFSLVISECHPLSHKKRIALKDFADEPFIGFPRSCSPSIRRSVLSICNSSGFSPRIVHETPQINAILRLVESNMGYSILPTNVKKGYNLKLRFIELAEYPERTEISLAYNPLNISSIASKAIKLINSFSTKNIFK